jgi:hypothetical protein
MKLEDVLEGKAEAPRLKKLQPNPVAPRDLRPFGK